MIVLTERLRAIDKSQNRLTAERLKVLSEIAELDAQNGVSSRQTASRVARATSSTPAQAASEVATAKQVAALPGIADAHARGEITNGQLGAVAAIASTSSEEQALALAKTATSSQLHRHAAASRGKLHEERRKAHTGRYLAFKPEDDGQSTRIHGRLPFAESKELETQLRKIADRIGLCDKDRPSPSARLADALLIATKGNASQALHHHEHKRESKPGFRTQPVPPNQTSRSSETSGSSNDVDQGETRRSNGFTNGGSCGFMIDYDAEPFPEIDADYEAFISAHSSSENGSDIDAELDGTNGSRVSGKVNQESTTDIYARIPSDEQPSGLRVSGLDEVVVQRSDTQVIIHWNAQTGEVNYENGPPIDHPRLLALLCDARIDLQHCDPTGLPTGLVTSAYHASWRQDRYLAFRDGPCRIPECQGIGKTQAHHFFENRTDRVTSVQYMINLCNRCHQEHHDNTFTITGSPEQTLTFTYKNGSVLTSTARPLPTALKQPKPIPLSKHQSPHDTNLFATSA